MKLTEELKQKIDAWFESKSEEEVYEILKGYGLKEEQYTLDELKKRVDSLKDYATSLSSELNVELSIDIETEVENLDLGISCRTSVKGKSRINIID